MTQMLKPVFDRRNRAETRGRGPIAAYTFCANKPTQYINIQGLYTEEERQKVCDDYEKEHPATNVEDPERVNWEGTVICKGGTPYPCIFNKSWKAGFRKDILTAL